MNEFWRKTVHLVFGLLISLLIWSFPKEISLMLLGVGLLGGLWFIDLAIRGIQIPVISHLLLYLERDGVFPGKGAFFFVFSSLVTLILFPSEITALSVLVLSVLDGVATLIGLRYGRIQIINHKSIEGSGGAILITFIVLLFFLNPVQAIVISVIAGVVELVSPVDDNLIIPLVVAILVTFVP
jgi:dolichol kinase